MLQKALTLTNEAGKAFINSWILNFSADGKADIIAVFTPADPGNFFWLTRSLKKDTRIYNINTFPLCRFAPSGCGSIPQKGPNK